jgi:SAM-dependent methyltransferase
MVSFLNMLTMALSQQCGGQCLARTPEPQPVSEEPQEMRGWTRANHSFLALVYAAAAEIITRCRENAEPAGAAIDLGCGPGFLTAALVRDLGYRQVLGVDLSHAMIEMASELWSADEPRLRFVCGNMTEPGELPRAAFSLVTCTAAAHHLADPAALTRLLRTMEALAQPSGLIVLMDLVRLRTARVTERFVEFCSRQNARPGLERLQDELRVSMYAAWTAAELRSAVPASSGRCWWHLVPRGLPTLQALIGLPLGRRQLYLRDGSFNCPMLNRWFSEWKCLWGAESIRAGKETWRLLRLGIATARYTRLEASDAANVAG